MATSVLNRTPKVLWLNLQLLWKRFWEYRFNAYFDIILRIAEIAGYLLFWTAILGQTSQLFQGWGFNEFLLMFGLGSFFVGFVVSFGYSAIFISESIVKGGLDKFLARPTYAWLSIWVELGDLNIMNFVTGTLILTYLTLIGYYLDPIKLLVTFVMIIMGTMITTLFGLCMGSLSFWFGRARGLAVVFDSFWLFADYPTNIYHPLIQALLVFTFPFVFIYTVPTQWMINQITNSTLIFFLLMEIAALWTMMILFYLIWKKGVKHYDGFGG